ncbi:DinB family protein [Chitinophaga arvensicola]|uniref:DinB superfamily protein n=1 Tax=Chitinophaga arvensicola TaxID=29529 RepID=A0A1I0RFU3_9BACT|nr:DinB family protein [Chitinophaga arvensicola]SEW39554.1 DinB superfamily protein [Chitinophaga arvensicola]
MRQALLQEVNATGDTLQQLLTSFSDEQLNTIPFEGSWTAAQVADHICKAGDCSLLYGPVQATEREPGEKVPAVKSLFLNFDIKMTSPEQIRPDEGYHPREAVLKNTTAIWHKLTNAAGTLDLTEECTSFEVPGFGPFTRFEWISFITIHTQRHIHQLQRIYDTVTTAKA